MGRRRTFETPQWHSPAEIARMLRIPSAKVVGWIRRGELLAVNVADNLDGRARWRVSPESLANFLRSRESQPPPTEVRHQRRNDAEIESAKRLLAHGNVPYFFASMRQFQYVLKHSA